MNHGLNNAEQKFANMRIAFHFLSRLKLRDYSKWRANKNQFGGVGRGGEVMLIQKFVLKVLNNETKILPVKK